LPHRDYRSGSRITKFIRTRHALALRTITITMVALKSVCRASLRQLAPRSTTSIATNHSRLLKQQWRGYATSMDAQQKVPLKTAAVREYQLRMCRFFPKILNKRILPSTRSSTRFVATSQSLTSKNKAHDTSTPGEEPPKALHKPHPLGELHIASRSRCARQCYAKYVSRKHHTTSGLHPR
jgi:hypothetical protein